MNPKEAIRVLQNIDLPRPSVDAAIELAIDALKKVDPTCGSCKAGILLMNVAGEDEDAPQHVEVCDTCKLFETDLDASAAVESLLALLHRVYRERYFLEDGSDTSVAGALECIEKRVS